MAGCKHCKRYSHKGRMSQASGGSPGSARAAACKQAYTQVGKFQIEHRRQLEAAALSGLRRRRRRRRLADLAWQLAQLSSPAVHAGQNDQLAGHAQLHIWRMLPAAQIRLVGRQHLVQGWGGGHGERVQSKVRVLQVCRRCCRFDPSQARRACSASHISLPQRLGSVTRTLGRKKRSCRKN